MYTCFFKMVSKSQRIGKMLKSKTSSKVRLRILLNWGAMHGVTCTALESVLYHHCLWSLSILDPSQLQFS